MIPAAQHKAITKSARKTNHLERFNNTLRQRVSRLVRRTLAFSKSVENHLGAIRYFIGHYNLTRAAFPHHCTHSWGRCLVTQCSLNSSFPLSHGCGKLIAVRSHSLSPLGFVFPIFGPHDGKTKQDASEDKKKNTHRSSLLLSL